jgi:hypothetical protein
MAALEVSADQALGLLTAEPSLLFEQGADVLEARLGELAAVLRLSREAARKLALEQPVRAPPLTAAACSLHVRTCVCACVRVLACACLYTARPPRRTARRGTFPGDDTAGALLTAAAVFDRPRRRRLRW